MSQFLIPVKNCEKIIFPGLIIPDLLDNLFVFQPCGTQEAVWDFHEDVRWPSQQGKPLK